MIVHDQRFNDLACYVYQDRGLPSINPLFAISTKSAELFPNGMKLLPEHCLNLFILLTRALGVEKTEKLNPTKFFSYLESQKTWNISMADFSKYEQQMKEFFGELVSNDPVTATSIIEEIHNELKGKFDPIRSEFAYLRENLFDMLLTVKKQDKLPCIIFHFNRKQCEVLASILNYRLWKGKYF